MFPDLFVAASPSTKLKRSAACMVLMALCACHVLACNTAPQELIGVWETAAPSYKDCEIEITPHLIIFRNEALYVSINYLKKIRKQKVAEKMLYAIYFEDKEGNESKIQVYLFKKNNGSVMRFKNRDEEWFRKKATPYSRG
jgi:hypothetical protein